MLTALLNFIRFAGHLELIDEGDDAAMAHEHTLERAFGQWFDIGTGTANDRDVFLRPRRRRTAGSFLYTSRYTLIHLKPGDFTQNPLFGNARAAHQNSATNLAHPLLMEPSST